MSPQHLEWLKQQVVRQHCPCDTWQSTVILSLSLPSSTWRHVLSLELCPLQEQMSVYEQLVLRVNLQMEIPQSYQQFVHF